MKMDFDTILYIVITLAVLIFSGLSGRKKKKAQMEEAARIRAAKAENGYDMEDQYEEQETEPEPVPGNLFETFKQSSNPFDKLEQILTGQVPQANQVPPPFESMEGKSMEGETMEDTVDEEEQILEDIRKRNEEIPKYVTEDKPETISEESDEENHYSIPELFENVDEIKKAVIYSEIMNRKY